MRVLQASSRLNHMLDKAELEDTLRVGVSLTSRKEEVVAEFQIFSVLQLGGQTETDPNECILYRVNYLHLMSLKNYNRLLRVAKLLQLFLVFYFFVCLWMYQEVIANYLAAAAF